MRYLAFYLYLCKVTWIGNSRHPCDSFESYRCFVFTVSLFSLCRINNKNHYYDNNNDNDDNNNDNNKKSKNSFDNNSETDNDTKNNRSYI